jgi:two-component system, OmpR family, alkaline phosphatase synthesis response regulator PhoP
MIKILIVEDEIPISTLIKMNLVDAGYHCTCAFDGQEAADLVESNTFDLVLLDIMLPKIDGYELLEYIKNYEIPTIFLTAKSEIQERVKGLRAGAEDYITKPFDISELLARVETVLRRYNKASRMVEYLDIVIDTQSRIATKSGKKVNLTTKEYELLLFFIRNKGRALQRQLIYSSVWEEDFMGDSRTVDLHVQRIRKKMKIEDKIVPVYKIGYRMEE